ncbi:hypothetical protein HH308_01275 [Gordonia sp. TBRC 11910]|uniref:N-acetyltransferase domain-containing protein n=1 Tax=Gordonia asplenii TaxID=2725283 RepID=A0A848KSJ3_9ACTN|nr:hypothetical protein [Gordonia asplenii]NMN99844.1 hypothetical protein [Gordonia asplenii]
MTVELVPITDADIGAVAQFLHVNHNPGVPWERACSQAPWTADAPNRGFMIRDGQRVVGTLLALYSERLIAGRTERFCNLGSWCVLPDYRSRSILLLKSMLAQADYHFTVLSPDDGPQEILAWHKFRFLDTSAALIPNLPWPTPNPRTRISSDPEVIASVIAGAELQLYRDHARALAVRHLVIVHGDQSCYIMYRTYRRRRLPVFASLLHVGDPELFERSWIPLTRHLLIRHGLIATLVELRVIDRRPRFAFELKNSPKMFRSDSLEPDQIDDLYSELVSVPW